MRTCCVLTALLGLIVLSGCATTRCDKLKAYQLTKVGEPLAVPSDLSEPEMRARSPEVEAAAPARRADGACLELPPPFDPEGEAS